MAKLLTNRREMIALTGTGVALAACGGSKASGSGAETGDDRAMGDANAAVTVIEYASITCPHCEAFHTETFPAFKEQYIDTGKVRFIFREIPTSPTPLAMAGFLMARCAPEDKYFDVLGLLFEKRAQLTRAFQAGTAREELLKIAGPLGISESQFDACVRDQDAIERIRQVGEDAYAQHGVNTTPSFIIDGEVHEGFMTIEQMAEIIDPLVESAG